MKHILHRVSTDYESIFWATNEEKMMQMPKTERYEVGDVVILSPYTGLWGNFVITSKKEVEISFPTPEKVGEFDSIATEVRFIKKCYLYNKCHTKREKERFIETNYAKIFNKIFGKKSFKVGEKGFIYGFKTINDNVLNKKCTWTRLESPESDYTTSCDYTQKSIENINFCSKEHFYSDLEKEKVEDNEW
jgi:hypothetical protein